MCSVLYIKNVYPEFPGIEKYRQKFLTLDTGTQDNSRYTVGFKPETKK